MKRRRSLRNEQVNLDKFCAICGQEQDPFDNYDPFLVCQDCKSKYHPACTQISPTVADNIYSQGDWQCADCKTCMVCKNDEKDESLMFCDGCDKALHTFCNNPPFEAVPMGITFLTLLGLSHFKDSWFCNSCRSEQSKDETAMDDVKSIDLNKNDGNRNTDAMRDLATAKESDLESFKDSSENEEILVVKSRGRPKKILDDSDELQISEGELKIESDEFPAVTLDLFKSENCINKSSPLDKSQQDETNLLPDNQMPDLETVDYTRRSSRSTQLKVDYTISLRRKKAIMERAPAELKGAGRRLSKLEVQKNSVRKFVRLTKADKAKNVNNSTATTKSNKIPIIKLKLSDTKEAVNIEEKKDRWLGVLTGKMAEFEPYCPSKKDLKNFEAARTVALKKANRSESEVTFGPKINCIQFGSWQISTWYPAPYPEEYNQQSMLYLCEYCLKYMKDEFGLNRHKAKCPLKHPPGDEIYRDGILSVFEIDGKRNKVYSQNLCLLAKNFIDHKTLYYDVEPFLFYVMTENDEFGYHFVGYFSKEKRTTTNYNLSCIVTLPIHQRKGYGNLLIDFSYLLSKRQRKPGTPEKPLSDLGLISYRNYWRRVILKELSLLNESESISVQDLVDRTCLTPTDVVSTLYLLDMIKKNIYGSYCLAINKNAVIEYIKKFNEKNYPSIKPESLRWTPFYAPASVATNVNDETAIDKYTVEVVDDILTEDIN
ncbi:hypothetical protein HDU92_005531 [Lobulomyces angularis]|nr:hypothetical protein HDU92_005531 [Lobulomyces angularis]